jgi:hypothetical protein
VGIGGTQFIEVLCSGDTLNSLRCKSFSLYVRECGEDTIKKIWLRCRKKTTEKLKVNLDR